MKKNIAKSLILLFTISIVISCQPEKLPQLKNINHADWSRNAAIYEMNIRQFSEEGTIATAEKDLPRLKEMGISIVWLMPINPIGKLNRKGALGSYYSVRDYKAFNPEFGELNDFKNFVNAAHKLGLRVIVDWVANHTSWDNVWVKDHPDFYTKNEEGNFVPPVADWHDVIDLNYDNKELWNYMLDAMKYWVNDCDIDGYRCDVAAMVPTEFWKMVIIELNKIKPVFMLAEASEPELHRAGFDMTYNWQLKDMMNAIAKGEKDANDLENEILRQSDEYGSDDYRMNFTTNHDENSWNGTTYERLGDGVKTFAVLAATLPGMPLVYNGQESGLNKSLEFFEKDLINWDNYPLAGFYSKLLNMKQNNPALWNGTSGGKLIRLKTDVDEIVFAFERENENFKVVVVLNLSNEVAETSLKLTGKGFTNLFSGEELDLETENLRTLNPWEYRVYYK